MSSYHQLLVTAQSNERNESAAPTVASGALREIDPQCLRKKIEDAIEIRGLRRQLVLRDEIARLLVSLAARLQSSSAAAR